MQSFIIKKYDGNYVGLYDYEFQGFHYKIKTRTLDVREIIILDPNIINCLISRNFDKKYKKILSIYFSAFSDDEESDGSLITALDEIERLRRILIKKFHLYLNKEIEKKLLKKLKLLEEEIKTKIIDIKLIKEEKLAHTNFETKNKSR